MLKRHGAIFLVGLAFLPGGCASLGLRDLDVRLDRVREAARAVIAANNRCDLDGAVACYADDVVWLPPAGPAIEGKAAISERYRAMFETFEPRLAMSIEEVESDGSMAFVRGVITGRLVPRDGRDADIVREKFLMSLRREDGSWRIARLMWSPNVEADAN